MKWVALLCLLLTIGFGVRAFSVGINPNHSHGEIRGQLRVWGKQGTFWHGEMIVDAGAMKRRFGNWTKHFDFTVTDAEVAKQVDQAASASGTIEVEYRQWLIKPASHTSDFTVVAATAVQ